MEITNHPEGTEIPYGWGQLAEGEVAKRSDYCRAADVAHYEWERVEGIEGWKVNNEGLATRGRPADGSGYIIIRKGYKQVPKPKPESEWMNPWD